MVATMVQRLHSFAVWVCPPSASFWKLSGQAKENRVPPRTEPREVIFAGEQIRCLLVHDHVLLRQGLRRLLADEPDIDVVSEAGNAAECLRKVYELQPDVLVADAATFGMPASEAALLVARESPQTKIVFLSTQQEPGSPFGGSGAPGCDVRQTSAEELADMVRNSPPGPPQNPQEHVPTHHDQHPP